MSEGLSEGRRREVTGEQPIEVRRYLAALRRSWLFIAAFVILITAVAVVGSKLAAKHYRATATIVQGGALISDSPSPDVVSRQLETIRRLLTTSAVLDLAREKLPPQDRDSLSGAVSSAVDPGANIISVTATSTNPDSAAAIANAATQALLTTQSAAETKGIASAIARLQQQIARLRATGASDAELQAVRDRISELVIAQASIGSDLRLAQLAGVPSKPYSPRPVRNGVIAFFAALFLAILIAIGRDLLRPRISEPRELAQLLDLPVLARVPVTRGRSGRKAAVANAIAREAYQTLQASIQYANQDGRKIVVVTSALEQEGKTTAAIGLAQALARAGRRTLLICADLRLPTLHERLEIKRAPGLTDLLQAAANPAIVVEEVPRVTHTLAGFGTGSLDVIPSGSRMQNPAELLFGGPFDTFVNALGSLDYDHVIVDGPPLLGIADGHVLVQRGDSVLLVARPDRLTVEQVVEVREKLERLHANTLGLVVCGDVSDMDTYGYAYAQSSLSAISAKGYDSDGLSGDVVGRRTLADPNDRRAGASRQPK
jgi:polysaccharide biosynthesis transport protein